MGVALQVVIGAIVGYLLGMIPTGAIVGRSLGVDLTRVGSGSTGATNVLRTVGVRWAVVVALGDFLKGLAAVLLTGWAVGGAPWDVPSWGQVMAASFAVFGHTFSPLLGFRGGRGIVTGGGGLVVLSPIAFVVAVVCGAVTIGVTRYVSLGSLVGTVVAGAIVIGQALVGAGPPAFLVYGTVLPAFIILAHRGNIRRLLSGTERKLSRGDRPVLRNEGSQETRDRSA
jgi:glycerol-3-phosphate acyltransferase PlsY